ncbi:hypothetical protein ILUMI_01087 [Ignelater luminosus]|uniref:SWIM-type domain-containing protein n=1 Tax=Ignelater luminosus TaxID=2038154 RepID=A0A8K0DL04_IGNLU|nr:hypothetical protein ILUMI_01087 [Ignelater luminosus]
MESNKCQYWYKEFSSSSSRNRHIKNVHNKIVKTSRISRIKCSLCLIETGTHENLKQHLTESHQVSVDEIYLSFRSKDKVAVWLQTAQIEANYFICRQKQNKKGNEFRYACNRSDLKGKYSLLKKSVVYNIKSYYLFKAIKAIQAEKINYLTKKHNIDKRRHDNDVIAVGLKVQEWNQNGKNYAFFFKQEGESHPVLKDTDFAVGFMNATMEKKLKDFGKIICMDGTHCTNRKGMDLTIMLVKDDKNAEFPKILNETKVNEFVKLSNEYFDKLKHAQEIDFLDYLQKYYFQDQKRISMWTHCFRLEAGINTIMALESLNNLLKTNQIKRRTNITVEKLLDKIEDLVDSKMWQRILNMERPNANSYQNKVTLKRHKTAERMDRNLITEVGFGEFQVRSSKGEEFYSITYNKVCETDCRFLYCRVCKICFHRYKCQCHEYSVKTSICKHIHLVCLYEQEKEDNSVLGDVEALGDQSKEIKNSHQEEIQDFIESKRTIDEGTNEVDREAIRRMGNQEILNALNELDFETHSKKLKTILKLIKQDDTDITNKRKMEKQEYFPTKRRRC